MSSIVHQDQTCGVVGCTIFSNLFLLSDVLDMIAKTNEPGNLVSLNQEKAFNRVDHEFIMRPLRKFGFGPSFFALYSALCINLSLALAPN